MKPNKFERIIENIWPVLAVLSLLCIAAGCTQGELQDATSATIDAGAEHGPDVVNSLSQGDWVGAITAGVCLIASAVGGYFIYRKKRKKND